MEIFRKNKENYAMISPNPNFAIELPKEAVLMGANLEVLREIKQKMEEINLRLSQIEKKLDEKLPEKALSENTFRQEIIDGEEVIDKIISEIKFITRPLIASRQQLTIVEQKKIEKIVSFLQEYGKLSSSQLAQLMNLSRTRCNEYFKKMEDLGLVEGIEIGKEKYYRLKN
ncbi:MAG: winged helix-turn-helix domain-containing protein [Candidatus Aenigmatarchaeota archaeon]